MSAQSGANILCFGMKNIQGFVSLIMSSAFVIITQTILSNDCIEINSINAISFSALPSY